MRTLDEKAAALRAAYALHPRPEAISDPLFAAGQRFFDARDLVQVRYEMLRHVRVDGHTATQAAAAAGLSRSAFYAAQRGWDSAGIAGLLPGRPGPHGPHKLTPPVLRFIEEIGLGQRQSAAGLAPLLRERFGLVVHRRSIERARGRQRCARPPTPTVLADTADLAAAYETLRRWVVEGPSRTGTPPGLALLLRRGMAAWLAAWHADAPPPSSPGPPWAARPSPVPLALSGRVVIVLANMVLSCQWEGST